MSMDYRTRVTSQNIGPIVQSYMAYRGAAEMDTTLLCSLSMETIKIPVRHRGFTNIRCIFELENWLEYSKQRIGSDFYNCPGCRASAKLDDYGIDYTLYHAIATLNHIDPNATIYKRDKMSTMYSQYKFYAISKKDPSKKTLLPGCSAVFNVLRRSQKAAKVQTNNNNQNAQDEISRTIEKLEQYLKKKKYEAIKNSKKNLNTINNKLQNKAAALKQAILQNCRLVEIGKQSITTNDFVFALKKINREKSVSSILVIYYPHYNIWLDFELLDSNGQPYQQLQQALYIKNSSQRDYNIIYIIGGKTALYEQSSQFLQIEIPKDPFTKVMKLTLKRLPDLLQVGYNYMGTFYEGKIFIFYGQKKYIKEKYITDELLNLAQVFKNNQWSRLNLEPISRFDGSHFAITHYQFGRCIIFYGGVPGKPDGLENCACTQQKQGQIFVCKDEAFYGGPKSTFQVKFPLMPEGSNQDRGISTPIFSIPYFQCKQLLISGDYLKENLTGKRQIYTFDWGDGDITLNEIFSLEPPEQILTPQKDKYQYDKEIFTPVQDCEGCVIYGNFYTIHQYEEQQQQRQKNSTLQLLSINQTNGLFKILPYQDRTQCQDQCKKKLQSLRDKANTVSCLV